MGVRSMAENLSSPATHLSVFLSLGTQSKQQKLKSSVIMLSSGWRQWSNVAFHLLLIASDWHYSDPTESLKWASVMQCAIFWFSVCFSLLALSRPPSASLPPLSTPWKSPSQWFTDTLGLANNEISWKLDYAPSWIWFWPFVLVLFMARLGAASRSSQPFLSQPKPAETQLVLSVSTQAGSVQLRLERFRADKISYFGQQHATWPLESEI